MEEKCSSCKETIGNQKFCSFCGKAARCLQCNARFKSVGVFCGTCGAKKQIRTFTGTSIQSIEVPAASMNPNKKSFNFKKIPKFVWVIIAAIILFTGYHSFTDKEYSLFNDKNTPENTIENFFKAIEKQDLKAAQKHVHPTSYDVLDDIDFRNFPFDTKFEILEYDDIEFFQNEASVETSLHISSQSMEEVGTITVEVGLIKVKREWLIDYIY